MNGSRELAGLKRGLCSQAPVRDAATGSPLFPSLVLVLAVELFPLSAHPLAGPQPYPSLKKDHSQNNITSTKHLLCAKCCVPGLSQHWLLPCLPHSLRQVHGDIILLPTPILLTFSLFYE